MISIICPIFNEEKFIAKCIDSILAQDYPQKDMELLLIDGMSNDRTRQIITDYQQNYTFIKLLDNPYKVVPYALNIGIQNAQGDVIMRIDGHCTYPTNYVSVLSGYLYKLNADNVGGVWNTLPANSSITCRAIAIASSHSFGVGGSLHKIGATKIVETDTVPFGCYKREVFDKIGLFDEELIRNQDDEFNARLKNSGGKIFLIPEIIINYTARDSIYKEAKMFYQYGLFKPLVNKKLGNPATIRQFVPPVFVAGLLLGAIASICYPPLFYIYANILALYLLINIGISIREAIRQKTWSLSWMLPYVFFIIHFSYGWGYLKGLCFLIFKHPFVVNVNR